MLYIFGHIKQLPDQQSVIIYYLIFLLLFFALIICNNLSARLKLRHFREHDLLPVGDPAIHV